MKRDETVSHFRDRLVELIDRSELSQTHFAAAVGIDRSTLSQLLSAGNARLPRIDSAVAIAQYCQVSLDWLLGLSRREVPPADIVKETLEVERDMPSPLDERLMRWHQEAAGYKIRHVPTSFPDVLKTEAVIRHEYAEFATLTPQRRIEISQSRLRYLRQPDTDMEVCMPLQALAAFAHGEGIWQGLPAADRRAQLQSLRALCDELYPSFRWFLFDGRHMVSTPYTVFGPIRGAVYIGQMYFVFHLGEHVRALAQHFDSLIRAATVQPHEIGAYLRRLEGEVG